MKMLFKNILIVADIEGSSGCWSYEASSFKTKAWRQACVEMSRDVNAVVKGLLGAGAVIITVKDFHRTGFNLLPELIHSRAKLVYGYRQGPVPGIGHPGKSEAVLFLGLHAASGTDGFLAHTLTSRIQQLLVNGKPMAEVALFASSLAPFGIRPIFFSGCPVACAQAKEIIPRIHTCSLDKTDGPDSFDAHSWREKLMRSVIAALSNDATEPYLPRGPFEAVITMRDGKKVARKLSTRWGYAREGSNIYINADDIHTLYMELIRLCYLTPLIVKVLPLALFVSNLRGRLGLAWLRRKGGISRKENPGRVFMY
jgi:D-aminopeptidase